MMDWLRWGLCHSVKLGVILLLLGCLATVAAARNRDRGARTLGLPDTEEECEEIDAAQVCIEEQRQEQRDNAFKFCNDLIHGKVERKMRNCLSNILESCSEDVKNRQQDMLRNGVAYMQDTCYEPEYPEETDNSQCDPIEIVSCLQPLLQAAGMEEDLMTGITLLTNPSAMALNQEPFCSALPQVDLEEIHECVGEVSRKCAESGSRPDSFQNYGYQNITETFFLIQQLCDPGCENLEERINALDLCDQNIGETEQNCKQIQDGIYCAVDKIRCCHMLEQEYRKHLNKSNILSRCPDLQVNLSCDQGGWDSGKGGHTADNYQGDQHQAITNGNGAATFLLKDTSPVLLTCLLMVAIFSQLCRHFHVIGTHDGS